MSPDRIMKNIHSSKGCATWREVPFLGLATLAFLIPRLTAAQSSSQPLILDHADSTILIQKQGETEYHLYGNVSFIQGDTRLQGDSAVWMQGSGHVQFDGHVVINQPGTFLGAQQVIYRRGTQSLAALGEVAIDDTTESFALRSQRAVFDRERSIARADSMPVVYWDFLLDSASQTIVQADT